MTSKGIMILNMEAKDLSPELLKAIRAGDEHVLENIRKHNAFISAKTSYILKNGMPISYIKRMYI